MMKKILVLLIALSMVLGFTGCSSANEDNSPSAAETQSGESMENDAVVEGEGEEAEAITEAPQRTEFYIGEYVEMGDLVVRLNDYYESKGEGFNTPGEGFKFVNFDVTFYNVGSDPYSLSTVFGFEMVDDQMYTYSPSWMAPTKGVLDGTMNPGMMVRGEVAFEIPEESAATELLFDYDLFISGQLVLNLDRTQEVKDQVFENAVALEGVHSMGDTVSTDDFDFVVNSFRWAEPGQFDSMPDGYKHLVVDITATNTSSETKTLSTLLSFSVINSDGYVSSAGFYTDGKGNLDGDVAAGRSNRGEVGFKAQAGQDYMLIIDAALFTEQIELVDLGQ